MVESAELNDFHYLLRVSRGEMGDLPDFSLNFSFESLPLLIFFCRGVLLRPSDKNHLFRYPVYMYVKKPFFIILVHFISHTKLRFFKLTPKFLFERFFLFLLIITLNNYIYNTTKKNTLTIDINRVKQN